MKATKLIVAAGLALASSFALAETGVKTYAIDNVTNVYGRAGVAAVQLKGGVQAGAADVATVGRNAPALAGKTLVTTGHADVNVNGRS
ncbi:MAG TPA: hypothetical protein VNM24_04880 [Burkholderiales bacterium]|jgi:hypothetical protein|nr:hypothetical protein [Burkholderiales bacterium]